ncbi:MAG: hypothetical protein A2504_02140 [Bdellovibrionales bacterium RIFOXYD12_FULL_39_22]|nr:MAG: hypothetical protein A2385_12165 [Bdellovibrionales bacterium RIFOXYB1_FULL_39_21]OFZ41396.1 MAG: hypothetical protein A2485_01335 [Bdellovibrionales bacterium RIFOXYC12_FULL_39_17]OFZ45351.1 MAG: hypothetical protein A2404_13350 [Bdellovibrionales bacterium RIFOXYC1_FULL_39_130]OFZ71351.1 MAG: hypothetical protein A2451_04690 [Bdellovibrionales bacterium RIFOXYC2_FULL_39_8]OFZ74547.1 MAG: hypothetical protein A2560_12455 [Bdellovibrionales bacterium RIFOXYD1_FULL_39_84]OFZ92556.1 MAG:
MVIKHRIIFTFLSLAFFFFIVFLKAFIVQVYDRAELIEKSKKQIFRESKVFSHRGNIYDRNGSPLAINVQTYSIFTIPKNVKGGNENYRKLGRIVPELGAAKILSTIKNREKYTWIARKISLTDKQVDAISELSKNGGIYIEPVPQRIYPNRELMSQVLGFVGVDNMGLAGAEYQFDDRLRGRPSIIRYYLDAKGRPIKTEGPAVTSNAEDIYLSLDKELQAVAEKYLKEAVLETGSKIGGIGIIDPANGEILAVANYPSFDANTLSLSRPENRKLSFVVDPIEPGSIFKILTVASALENKVATPTTNYYCEQGRFLVDNHYISEAETTKKYEWLSVKEIIEHSSNIGTTKIAFDLTFPKLNETLIGLNIGQKTGIGIPGESRGIFAHKQNVSPLALSNLSFGQGVATTGIQILSAYAAIANGGNYITPTIVKRAKEAIRTRRVFSYKTAKELTDMLVGAVEQGTGSNAMIPYFKIAGKTGTAQRPDTAGGYSGYIPGFIGFPVNVNKKFVIYVYLDNPQTSSYYGNTLAAPVFKKVAQYILYNNKEIKALATADRKENIREQQNFDTIKTQQSATRLFDKKIVPNLLGLDRAAIRRIIERYGYKIVERGIGVVTSQMPDPQTQYEENSVINIRYSPPEYE